MEDLSANSSAPRIAPSPDFYEKVRDFYDNADAAVEFFGRVIDQDGKGVNEATIHFQLERSGLLMADGRVANNNEMGSTISSKDGTFSIKGKQGLALGITHIEKEGYRDGGQNTRSFGFRGTPSLHQADLQKPVEFLIVSNDSAKTRKLYHDFPRFSWNQGPVDIDIPDLGNIRLLPTREKKLGQLRGFDWHLTVSMDVAELARIDKGHAPIAPLNGYQKYYEYGSVNDNGEWSGGVDERYAFRTSGGLFGTVDLNIVSRRDDGAQQGSLEVRINESGSRNLDR